MSRPEPGVLEQKDWAAVAKTWDDIVESFVLTEGGVSVLLSALDREVMGAVKSSPWRGLPWEQAALLPANTPSPVIGRLVFCSAQSPTLLTQNIPQYPLTPAPSWWSVSTANLDSAARRLRQQTPLIPDPACTGLTRLFAANNSPYILNTRSGSLTQAHTAKKWRARVLVGDVRLHFKDEWAAIHLSPLPPQNAADGDAWINPDTIEITPKGAKLESKVIAVVPANRLLITLALLVEYTAAKDANGSMLGSWNPSRSLRVELHVQRRDGGQWDVGRKVDIDIELYIPSPFSPTVFVSDAQKLANLAPDSQDDFESTTQSPAWLPVSTPTILLKEEGPYDVQVYDGNILPSATQFGGLSQPTVAGDSMGVPSGALFPAIRKDLDDGVLIGNTVAGANADVAVIKVKERSSNLSSSLMSAVRGLPTGRKQPSSAARQSMLGRYQAHVTRALCNATPTMPNSLFQYVLGSTFDLVEWQEHAGTPKPVFLLNLPQGFMLPGIGNGPSDQLVQSPEWAAFMVAIRAVGTSLGLAPGAEEAWLTSLDFSNVSATNIRAYIEAHKALVKRARTFSAIDLFWASYPFAALIVDGQPGAKFGQLLAVLLSPLHPVRLAWAYSVTLVAKNNSGDASLLQLAEGWNLPCTGMTVSPTGQLRQLVAVPTDPGQEQDFLPWSALAVLSDSNLADLPAMAGGQPLPWGGRTGINAKVVERAIKDYLLVHPHVNAIEVDVRSVNESPRAQEIDEALLELVAAENLREVEELGGGARIWDSANRQGESPTRDRLFAVRGNADPSRPFEWHTYDVANPPTESDIALVENASVHLGVIEGNADGVLGLLPLRRFSPSMLQALRLDQNFSPLDGEDVLGLAGLLREIENPPDLQRPALRASPQAQALGLGHSARWEVLGTFNLDAALLSALVAQTSTGSNRRLLWEWRPSWMPVERKANDLARRPYYVVARIPASLLKALETRQGFTIANALELLQVLGHRGIGLASLNIQAGTQESAAAGFFYAMQLLLPPAATAAHAPGPNLGDRLLCVIPLDAVESILQGMAGSKLDRRADLIAVAVSIPPDGSVKLCFVPVEVKHHGMPSNPESIPPGNHPELKRAREQLVDTAKLLTTICDRLRAASDKSNVAGIYLQRLAMATLIDLALSFAPTQANADFRAHVLRGILHGRMSLGVGDAVLTWFAPGSAISSGGPCVVDRYGATTIDQVRIRELFIDPSVIPGLWWAGTVVGANESQVRSLVNDSIEAAFATCTGADTEGSDALDGSLRHLLDLSQPHIGSPVIQSPPPESPTMPEIIPEKPSEPPALHSPAKTSEESEKATPKPVASNPVLRPPETTPTPADPRAVVGWASLASRWALVGKLAGNNETVALDLDHPKTIGIFGYMGSGKSYLLGNLIESAVQRLPGLNKLEMPLAVVVFNYRRNAADRFELTSLGVPNSNPSDMEHLASDYGAAPAAVQDLHVLCLPGELRADRQREYGTMPATELYFDPRTLGAEDWELLMGEPGSDAVFARTIRNTLQDLRASGNITFEDLEQQVTTRLTGQSRTASRLRFDFVRRYISQDRGVDFASLLRPGRVLIVDLRQPLFNKDDALRFFLVCANQISKVQGQFNKMLVFDEAHEYMSDVFGERMESRIRLMRHEGTTYVFATQDVSSIPLGINRFLTTRFVFDLGTRENVQDLEQVAPEFRGFQLLGVQPGSCFVQANSSLNGVFSRPREIRVRPRVSLHGGSSQIFSRPPSQESS